MKPRVSVSMEEHFALENALIDYLLAVDGLDDLDQMMACFTEDAVLDLTGLNLGHYDGADAIRGFFAGVFETMELHMHTMSNFRVTEYSDNEARVYAYVNGMGHSRAGVDVQIYVYYDLRMRRTVNGWKISHFYEAPKLLMSETVERAFAD